MNIEQKILEQIWDTLMQNDKNPNHFNFATDLRYDHSINYNPNNPTISLVVEKEGRPTKYEVSIRESEWMEFLLLIMAILLYVLDSSQESEENEDE